MGTWGTGPWDSDGAADWLAEVFEGAQVDAQIEKALRYDDDYGPIRSAAYLLTVLGHSAYVWPGDWDARGRFIDTALARLRAMAAEGSEYRELWGDNPEIIATLAREIAALEAVK